MNYICVIGAYLIGAIPFGLLFGKIAGVDIRLSGSGNIGATNVSRLVGRKMGALTLAADVGKGFLPMLAAAWLLRDYESRETWVALCGAAAFMGHLFPVYLGFRGGKGVATALGIFLYLDPLAVLVVLGVFFVVVAVSGYVSLGSLTAAAIFPGMIWMFGNTSNYLGLAVFIVLFIWIKHWKNLGRLWRHEEKSWKKRKEAST